MVTVKNLMVVLAAIRNMYPGQHTLQLSHIVICGGKSTYYGRKSYTTHVYLDQTN